MCVSIQVQIRSFCTDSVTLIDSKLLAILLLQGNVLFKLKVLGSTEI